MEKDIRTFTNLDRQEREDLQARELTADEVAYAFLKWRRTYRHLEFEKNLEQFYTASRGPNSYKTTRIRQAREALFLSASSVAKKMHLAPSGLINLEHREKAGQITIKKLQEVAEAMDCDLVYAIVPKKEKAFSQIIWQQVVEEAKKASWLKICDPLNKSGALASVVRELCRRPSFRRAMGWTRIVH